MVNRLVPKSPQMSKNVTVNKFELRELGLSENNIRIVDIGDGGVSAEDLAQRNSHNVPLKTIQRMLASHKGVGPLTVEKILNAKGWEKEIKVKI